MAVWLSVFVTMTFTAPAAWAGVVAVIDVLLASITFVAGVPPKLTLTPVRNPVPVMVIAVPPLFVPVLGVIEATVGAGFVGVVGLVVEVRPPPQLGNTDTSNNREARGNQFLGNIRGTLSEVQKAR